MGAWGPESPDGLNSSDAATGSPAARSRLTLRRVAELAGVSSSTASRVLNGRSDVSDETRLIVERVARSHGYQARRYQTRRALPASQAEPFGQIEPFGQARPSRERSGSAGERLSGLVGVTTTTSGTAYFSTILTGITEALAERDMWALVCPTRQERHREVSAIQRLMRSEMVGALLLLPEESPDELRALKDDGLAFVVVDPLHNLGPDIPVVSAANSSGAYQATAHLLQLGHRRIGIIAGRRDGAATRARLQGHYAALAEAGIMPDPQLEVEADFLVPGGAAGASQLLALATPPTAIFAFNDCMAVGALHAARARGLRLPEDLSVVGFDDTPEAEAAYPGLTTVYQPLKELGRMAVSLLIGLIDQHQFEPLHVELATRLVVRLSTAPPALTKLRGLIPAGRPDHETAPRLS
jgi:LacI family transcriptional regulator